MAGRDRARAPAWPPRRGSAATRRSQHDGRRRSVRRLRRRAVPPGGSSARARSARAFLGEELLAVGEAVGLEEEAEDDGAVRRHRLVLVAGRPPDKLPWPADALVI